MATLYRKMYPVEMPAGAEIVTRRGKAVAQWTDRRGKVKSAPVAADGKRIMHEADVWYLRYRAADGVERRVSTGCRDQQAAGRVMADLLADVEKVRSGILSPEESQAVRHAARDISEHVADFLDYLKTKTVRGRRVSESHRYNVEKQLNRLVAECGFKRIGDITRQRMTKWLGEQTDASEKAPRTVLKYRNSLTGFCKWAVKDGRLAANPLIGLTGVEVDEDRRQRRPLTLAEVGRLLDTAARRPLNDALMIRRGQYKGQLLAKVDPAVQEQLVRLGRERALIYKTLVYTGLRKNELASLFVGDLYLDTERPFVKVAKKNTKNAKVAHLPLRADLVDELRRHLDEKLDLHRQQPQQVVPLPTALPNDTKLFYVPDDLVRIFDRDIAAAGIAKADADGRTVDVHSLRHTFATMLSLSGVLPRTAQELMRHGDIRLTMNTYTHLALIDTARAVEALPSVNAAAVGKQVRTGTYDRPDACDHLVARGESDVRGGSHDRDRDGRDFGAGNSAEIGTESGVNGAEIGDVFTGNGAENGAGRQSTGGKRWHAAAERGERKAAQVFVSAKERRPMANSVTGRRKASEGNRTLNIRFTKAVLYH